MESEPNKKTNSVSNTSTITVSFLHQDLRLNKDWLTIDFLQGFIFCRTIQYGYKFPCLLSQVDESLMLSSRPPFLQLLWMEPQWGSTINGNASRYLNEPTEWWSSKLATNRANCCYFTFLFWSTCLHIDTWAWFLMCNALQLFLLQHWYEIVIWWNKNFFFYSIDMKL